MKRLCSWIYGGTIYGRKIDLASYSPGSHWFRDDLWFEDFCEMGHPWVHRFAQWPNREAGHTWFLTVRVPFGPVFQLLRTRKSPDQLDRIGYPQC